MTLSFAPERIEHVAARAPEALCAERQDARGGPGREDRGLDGAVRLDGAGAGRRRRRGDRRARPHPRGDAARADRGAGDRARPPDRGAAAGLPSRRQQADRARRLGRGAARRRAAGAGWPTTSTCRSSASPTPSSTSCSPSTRAARTTPRDGEDEVPETPDDPVSRPGDLWLLGPHRLLCGDATVITDLDRLMAGRRPTSASPTAPTTWTTPAASGRRRPARAGAS